MKRCVWHIVLVQSIATILLLLLALFSMSGCRSLKSAEKVNVRDSVAVQTYYDTSHVTITDTVRVEQRVEVNDSTYLWIQFGDGGGTYNTKTGLATNVSAVSQTSVHSEVRDSLALLTHRLEALQASKDSMAVAVHDYEKEVSKERALPKRSCYDRFCSWWFWITALLLLLVIGFKVCDKVPMLQPYTRVIKMIFKIL